jgi:hypothetical protein
VTGGIGHEPPPVRRRLVWRRRPASGELFRAERPNHVWALDFQFDESADHRRLKLLNIVDEYTRKALAMRPVCIAALASTPRVPIAAACRVAGWLGRRSRPARRQRETGYTLQRRSWSRRTTLAR